MSLSTNHVGKVRMSMWIWSIITDDSYTLILSHSFTVCVRCGWRAGLLVAVRTLRNWMSGREFAMQLHCVSISLFLQRMSNTDTTWREVQPAVIWLLHHKRAIQAHTLFSTATDPGETAAQSWVWNLLKQIKLTTWAKLSYKILQRWMITLTEEKSVWNCSPWIKHSDNKIYIIYLLHNSVKRLIGYPYVFSRPLRFQLYSLHQHQMMVKLSRTQHIHSLRIQSKHGGFPSACRFHTLFTSAVKNGSVLLLDPDPLWPLIRCRCFPAQ